MYLAQIIKLVDKTIGPLLMAIFPKAQAVEPHYTIIKRILVIRPGGMGDALLLLPVLKKTHQSSRITIDILCEPRNRNVFECAPFINNIFLYQHPLSVLSLFRQHYDAVIDTEQSHFLSAITTRLVRAPVKVGFSTFNREKMFNHTIKYDSDYEADNFWQLFSIIFKFKKNLYFDFPYLEPSITKQALYARLENIICLFPGATTIQRHWPQKRWAAVCDRIAAKGFTPVLIGGSMEVQSCQSIVAYCSTKNIENLCNRLSIAQTVHLFAKTKCLISTDSGILHLGVICNVPTISLFGPSSPKKWGPKGQFDHIIHKNLDCAPCASFGEIPPCKNQNTCMMLIGLDDILKALEEWKDQNN